MTEREVLIQHIADHKAAIAKAEAELEKLNVTYSIGDRFMYNRRKYLLSANGDNRCILVNLSNGCVFSGSHTCGDLYRITEEEFERITLGKAFTRYWDNAKEVRTA